MADLDDPQQQQQQQQQAAASAAAAAAQQQQRVPKRQREEDLDDDDDGAGNGSRERRKIEIKFIQDKSRRHITFSKRKAGIMKKAYELSVLTGTQVLLLVVSETGLVYTFTTPKLQPLVTKPEGKNLIQACLNAPEPIPEGEGGPHGHEHPQDSPEPTDMHPGMGRRHLQHHAPPGPPLAPAAAYGMPHDPAAYQAYLQDQRQHYPPPPQGYVQPHDPR